MAYVFEAAEKSPSHPVFTTKDKLTSMKRGALLAKPRAAEFVKNLPSLKLLET
jgi:hypothetical protein